MKNLIFASLSAVMLAGTLVPFATAKETAPLVVDASQSLVAQAPVIASGGFVTVDQDHATTGTARIVEENGQRYIEFDAAFDTARGPDVQVVLYTGDTVPVSIAEEDYTVVADLESFEGAQRYALPASVDLDAYGAIAIWCAEFNVTFGYANLG
ncbi:MAG: DM13 domain-containing protein [Cyanobacteria bacterium P01_A01_bin.114]